MSMNPPALPFSAQGSDSASNHIITVFCWTVIIGVVGFFLRVNALTSQAHADRAGLSNGVGLNIPVEILGRTILYQGTVVGATSQGNGAADQARKQTLESARAQAVTPADQLDLAILTREVSGAPAAVEMLQKISPALPAGGELRSDAATLIMLYRGQSGHVSTAERLRLQTHLGWFGRLAVTQDLPPDAAPRVAILASANRSAALVLISVLIGGSGFLLGCLLLITAVILFSVGLMKFKFAPVPASVGTRSAFLESFTLWLVCFLCLSWVLGRLHWSSLLVHQLLFVAVTAAVATWPLARGLDWEQLRTGLGWRPGRGVFLEVLAGAGGYLAGLPVIAVAFVMTNLLAKYSRTQVTHPIVEEFKTGMTVGKVLALLFYAAICAPLLEETIFRGALYFHLRRRWGPVISAAVVAVVFAGIHPQGWAAIPVLASIALVLAALREWRGSLVASITAHAIHNGTLVLFMALALR